MTVPVRLARSTPASEPAKVRESSVPFQLVTVTVAPVRAEMAVVSAAWTSAVVALKGRAAVV